MSSLATSLPLASALRPDAVLLDVAAFERKDALLAAANAIAASHGLDVTLVFDALWRREQASSTALGHGFAVPHARVPGIGRPATLYLHVRKPIAFGAPDGQPVSHLLVILVPVDGDHEDHLRLLANVAGLVSDATFRERLRDAKDADEVASAFRDGIEPRPGSAGASAC